MTDVTWMPYEEYVVQSIWLQLRARGASNEVVREIVDECKAAKLSKEVLNKYQLEV